MVSVLTVVGMSVLPPSWDFLCVCGVFSVIVSVGFSVCGVFSVFFPPWVSVSVAFSLCLWVFSVSVGFSVSGVFPLPVSVGFLSVSMSVSFSLCLWGFLCSVSVGFSLSVFEWKVKEGRKELGGVFFYIFFKHPVNQAGYIRARKVRTMQLYL